VALGPGIIGLAVRTGRPVRIDDVRQSPDYLVGDTSIRSELAVPLKVADRVVGVLDAGSRRLAAFGEADERLLTVVAGLLAPAIENARLRARAEQQALDNTFWTWTRCWPRWRAGSRAPLAITAPRSA
jgi:GAF domain-containing protein